MPKASCRKAASTSASHSGSSIWPHCAAGSRRKPKKPNPAVAAAMSKTTNERPAGLRIWVALDASPRSTAALTAAVARAAELDAELAGLFVEDVNLQDRKSVEG